MSRVWAALRFWAVVLVVAVPFWYSAYQDAHHPQACAVVMP